MNEQLNKICEQIEALPKDATVEFRLIDGRTNTLLDSWDIDDLKALASYALRVEKMLEVVVDAELEINKDLARFVGVLGGWKEARISAQIYPSLLEAFEATQNDSNGCGTQETVEQ